jgi:hypothetical protein
MKERAYSSVLCKAQKRPVGRTTAGQGEHSRPGGVIDMKQFISQFAPSGVRPKRVDREIWRRPCNADQ